MVVVVHSFVVVWISVFCLLVRLCDNLPSAISSTTNKEAEQRVTPWSHIGLSVITQRCRGILTKKTAVRHHAKKTRAISSAPTVDSESSGFSIWFGFSN